MKRAFATPFLALAMLAAAAAPSTAATQTRSLKPSYVSPMDLSRMLGVTETAGLGVLRWSADGSDHLVTVRRNDAANLVVLEGEPDDLARVAAQAEAFDVAPRQIALEARIIEVDTDAARDLGIDWNAVGDMYARWSASNRNLRSETSLPYGRYENKFWSVENAGEERITTQLAGSFRLLDQSGAATSRDTPRILTLNNEPATILDGQRTTYVTRYAAYTNLFETQTMDSGLRLEVTPSLGESGYLRLELQAELTSLQGNLSGSPVKGGQIVRNTVMVKDGESIVLGGFTRTSQDKRVRRLPVLGRVLPWLFSREISTERHRETLIVITPRVVDLAGKPDEREKGLLEQR